MDTNEKRSRLMKMSWDIQRRKRTNRSKSLQQAWAIVNNADITVSYLVRKLNRNKEVDFRIVNQYGLFNT